MPALRARGPICTTGGVVELPRPIYSQCQHRKPLHILSGATQGAQIPCLIRSALPGEDKHFSPEESVVITSLWAHPAPAMRPTHPRL